MFLTHVKLPIGDYMSTKVQIGNKVFNIPDPGEKVGYAEETTDYLVAIADALATVQGPNDILQTSAALANNQTTPANIPGLVFSTASVLSIEVSFFLVRNYDSGSSTVTEAGNIIGSYDGSEFKISVDSDGNTGITFNIDNTGQMNYTSTDLTDHVTSTIVFKAKTTDI